MNFGDGPIQRFTIVTSQHPMASAMGAGRLLLALFAAGQTTGPAVERGVDYLLRTQRPDGSWTDPLWNGTGFPRVFFLKYHLYAAYFPLWALGVYRSAIV